MRLIEILESHGHKLKKETANEYSTQCPKCGGEDRFRVWSDANKFWCRQCHFKGDVISYFREVHQMTFPDAAKAAGQEDKIKPASNTDKVVPIKQPPPQPTPTNSEVKKKIVKTYDYKGTDGLLIYQVVRFEPKEFLPRRPGKTKPWLWDMRGVQRIVYRLPELLDEECVFFVEGEKDADNLWDIGYPATTIAGGSSAVDVTQKDHQALDALKDKTVWILPDNDPPGVKYGEKIAAYLYELAKEVKVVNLPVALGGDVSNFIKDTGDKVHHKLGRCVSKALNWEPPATTITVEKLLATEYESQPPIISQGVLHEGDGLLIAGEGGVGKSMLRLELAVHLAMGWEWLEMFEVPKAKKVLMLQYENSERTEKVRLKYMMEGMGIQTMPNGSISWIKRTRENRPDLTQKQGQERLYEIVAEQQPEVIIYDCLSNLHTANENDNIKMRNVMDIFKDIDARFKTASIVVHHFGKPSDQYTTTKYRVRGATAITDWADCVFTYTHQAHEHKVLRYLENTKMRNAKEIKALLLERNGNFLSTVVDQDTLCSPQRVAKILNVLGGEVHKQKDLIDAIVYETGCAERSARNFIYEAEKRGNIIPFKTGKQKGYRAENEA